MERRIFISLLAGAAALAALGRRLGAAERRGAPLPRRRPAAPAAAVIVLDPGHGGRDPGAIGVRGTHEKDVTLAICRAIRQQIEAARGGAKVVLTREGDEFLSLRERVDLAHEARADLFVSIHADAAPNPAARGLSAYTLSEKASDEFAGALAQRENRVDTIYGVDLKHTDRATAAILLDLARRHSHNASLTAKRRIVHGVGDKLRLLDNPMRAADFAVLKSPQVPSVLVETGFLSNPQDELLLREEKSRLRIARALAAELSAVARDLRQDA